MFSDDDLLILSWTVLTCSYQKSVNVLCIPPKFELNNYLSEETRRRRIRLHSFSRCSRILAREDVENFRGSWIRDVMMIGFRQAAVNKNCNVLGLWTEKCLSNCWEWTVMRTFTRTKVKSSCSVGSCARIMIPCSTTVYERPVDNIVRDSGTVLSISGL